MRNLLVFFTLNSILAIVLLLQAQSTNSDIIKSLVYTHLNETADTYDSIRFDLGDPEKLKHWSEEGSKRSLVVLPPIITYEKLERDKYERIIEVTVQVTTDTLVNLKALTSSDTLSKDQLKKVRSTEENPYKGENPFILGKFLIPASMIIISTGAIFALFFVRSGS